MTDKLITSADTGMASIETDNFKAVELFVGDSPRPTTSHKVSSALKTTGAAAFTVVGLNGNDELILAKKGSADARGVLTASIEAGTDPDSVAIFRGGDFNPVALTWDSSYASDADKAGAFDGSKEAIFIRKPNYA